MVQEKIGFRIKELRYNLGLSQEELADMAGIDRTYITSVENGHRNITIGTLEKIIIQLGVTFNEFFNF